MINGHSVMAVILARGGSKRLPRKNVLPLAGKPMIVWTIEAAQRSKHIDRVVVSTDDDEIAMTASRVGGIDLVMRPPVLASDTASSYDAMFHAVDSVSIRSGYVVLLQPTSPLRTAEDIDGCIEECVRHGAPSCITVTYGRPDANGAVYVAWHDWLREMRMFDSGRVVTYTMPACRSVDINTADDFAEAERLMATG